MKETATSETVETIPLIAYEARAERYSQIIRRITAGWTLSVLILSTAIAAVLIL